ncbi:PspC domain-containing protein [candidate division TA06 bacterium]|nr:PspC domain-containing protein [candidate division TA06 bacterium]
MIKKLYRSRDNRMAGGVCAGLAKYFELDPTLVRLGMAVLMVLGGGILIYIIAWLIVPEEPTVQ